MKKYKYDKHTETMTLIAKDLYEYFINKYPQHRKEMVKIWTILIKINDAESN